MTTTAANPSQRDVAMPTGRLALAEVAAVLIVGALVGLALVSSGRDLSSAGASAGPAVAAALVGVAFGLVPFWLMGPRPAAQWAMPVLFAGMLRMIAALSAAVWAWFAFSPDKLGYWTCFLAVGVAALIAEVRVALTFLADAVREGDRRGDDSGAGVDDRVASAVNA